MKGQTHGVRGQPQDLLTTKISQMRMMPSLEGKKLNHKTENKHKLRTKRQSRNESVPRVYT